MEICYDENIEDIQRIDAELVELGVESIAREEVLYKLGIEALPAIEVESSDTTNWTSRRTLVTYRGQHYELQIIEGVPISSESDLRQNNIVIKNDSSGIAAGHINLLNVSFETAVGFVPVIGATVTFMSAFGDIISGYADSFDENTVIDYVDSVALVSLTTHMKYIFVKGYGSGDSYQVLCYMGNSLEYLITTATAVDLMVDDELQTFHEVASYEGTEDSDYFNDYSIATKNYVNYREGTEIDFVYDYARRIVHIEILDEDTAVLVPIGYAPFEI